MRDLKNLRIGLIGAGKLGEALLRGLLAATTLPRGHLTATARRPERAEYLARELDIHVTLDNCEAVQKSDVILLAVKPQAMAGVLEQIKAKVSPEKLLISVAASVPTSFIENIVGDRVPVVRSMPNTPSLVGCGMTGLCPGRSANSEHVAVAKEIFSVVGRCLVLEERHMDAVTGLSASGPAFIYIIIESLAEAGVKVGLSREHATELAAQTVLGAAQMVLTTGEHPAKLKDIVTTPAGCTIDGILELEEGGLRVTLIKAVVKATSRASELVREKK
ncbi:MAG: pyrroline-5-carboxylate reductase [Candidatus Wallbacteria bacterium]|nr:pyrroline-5-carboxylate reductase [Candidatus Wallbacteria bacterium]